MRLARMAAAPRGDALLQQRLAADRRRHAQRGERVQIGAARDAAGGLPADAAESVAAASRYSARFGPASAPSRSMSVHSTCRRPRRSKRCHAPPTASASPSCAPAAGAQPRRTARRRCADVEGQADALGAECSSQPRPHRAARPRRCRRPRARRRAPAARRSPRRVRTPPPTCSATADCAARRAIDRAVDQARRRARRRGRRCAARSRRASGSAAAARAARAGSASRRRSRPCSRRTQRPPRRSMEGISSIRRASRKLRSRRAPAAAGALGMELHAAEIAARATTAHNGAP